MSPEEAEAWIDAFLADLEAVDPAEVGLEDLRDAVAALPPGRLEAVLAGPLGALVPAEVVRRFPQLLDADATRGADLRVRFVVDGAAFDVVVHDGRCEVDRNAGHDVQAVVTLATADLLRLATGLLSPVNGVITRKLAVDGDLQACLQLHRMMRVPGRP